VEEAAVARRLASGIDSSLRSDRGSGNTRHHTVIAQQVMAKRILILVRPQPSARADLLDAAAGSSITMDELLPDVFVATATSSVVLNETRGGLEAVHTGYLLAEYGQAWANSTDWVNALGPHHEMQASEPNESDRYLLLQVVGGGAPTDLTVYLEHRGVPAQQIAPGVYVARPTSITAGYFEKRLQLIAEEDLDGDVAVFRIHSFSSSLPI
jgi:hypothetical protein